MNDRSNEQASLIHERFRSSANRASITTIRQAFRKILPYNPHTLHPTASNIPMIVSIDRLLATTTLINFHCQYTTLPSDSERHIDALHPRNVALGPVHHIGPLTLHLLILLASLHNKSFVLTFCLCFFWPLRRLRYTHNVVLLFPPYSWSLRLCLKGRNVGCAFLISPIRMKRPFPLLLYFNILSVPVSSFFVVSIENFTRGSFDDFFDAEDRPIDRENDIAFPQFDVPRR